MASYHLSAQPVKRSEGRSVVAMAAYRAAARLKDDRRGDIADYTRRAGVAHAEIMAPDGSASWLRDREVLWNYVERIETRRDAQLAREINLALPCELSDDERLALLRSFVRDEFVALGMVADFAIHHPVLEKGDDPRNYHAHILLTLRRAQANGLRRVKTREWNSDSLLLRWRESWAERQNKALVARGLKVRVDHRSLAAMKEEALQQGQAVRGILLDRSAEIHVGPKARKASVRVPESRDRQVGPVREEKRRIVEYSRLDQGSRGAWNIRKLRKNIDLYAKRLAKTERQLARFRARQERYDRLLKAHSSRLGQDGLRQELHPVVIDVAVPFADRKRLLEHARRRREQVAWLIHELNILFFALLHIRESQLMRETVWANRMKRWRPNNLASSRPPGRRRLRQVHN